MKKSFEVAAKNLRRRVNPKDFNFDTIEKLHPIKNGVMGQERAIRAITFGMKMKDAGYNIYVAGPPNTGTTYLARTFIEKEARKDKTPPDWCYVYNFKDTDHPKTLRLLPGQAGSFKKDIDELVHSIRTAIPAVFDSDDYRKRREKVVMTYGKKRRKRIDELNKIVQKKGFILNINEVEMMVVPAQDGKPIPEETLMSMSDKERDSLRAKSDALQIELNNANRDLLRHEKEVNNELKKLDKEVALFIVEGRISDCREKYKDQSEVAGYIDEMKADILRTIDEFKKKPQHVPVESSDGEILQIPVELVREPSFVRYEVNVLIDNAGLSGAPVVYETNPTYTNLFGSIERKARYGTLFTDFTLIRTGALHRANGGYLILRASDVLKPDLSWEALKRAIKNREIKIEDFGELLGLVTTTALKPMPIPLNVKVILVGTPYLYQRLYFYDPAFCKMFKVKAHLDTVLDNTAKNVTKYVRCIGDICKRERLRHVDRAGVSRLLEYAMELAGDQEKLTLRMGKLTGIMKEANQWASDTNVSFIRGKDIEKAIREKDQRSNLYEDKTRELIAKGILRVETDGESDLSGDIHTKGVMILTGYLKENFAQTRPLTLSASLCFEQSYDTVEGDSASAAELFALLSAIADVPVFQGIAVTGAVSQKGEILPIGGVNQKVEGFFHVCKERGLSGKQGVIIPKQNVWNLMLSEEIVSTVKKGDFHIWAIEAVPEGIEILTGIKAGRLRKDNTFTPGSFFAKVHNRLGKLAKVVKGVKD